MKAETLHAKFRWSERLDGFHDLTRGSGGISLRALRYGHQGRAHRFHLLLGILRFFAFARFRALMPARIFERLSISAAL